MRYSEFLGREREEVRKILRILLAGFPEDALVSYSAIVPPGENILNQGDPRSDIFVLVSGRVSTVSKHAGYATYAFDEFVPVCMFGEHEALSGRKHIMADVRAKTNCRFLILRESDYLCWVQSDVAIMQRRVRSVVSTLYSQVEQERGALFLASGQRIELFLAAYYERHTKAAVNGVVCVKENRVTIAEETGFSLRTVNRAIREMSQSGVITLHRGKITISSAQYAALKRSVAL